MSEQTKRKTNLAIAIVATKAKSAVRLMTNQPFSLFKSFETEPLVCASVCIYMLLSHTSLQRSVR